MADFSSELITRENLITAFYGGDFEAKVSAVSAGYMFAAEFPDKHLLFAEQLATKTSERDAASYARYYLGTIKVDPEDVRAKGKNAAKDAVLELFKGGLKLEDLCFCLQVGVQLRLRTERAFDIVTEMLAMLPDFMERDGAATAWAAVRCLNLVANDIARSRNEHNLSHLCDKLLDACVHMHSWQFRVHAISLVDALGTYSSEGRIVPLGRLRRIVETAMDSASWSSAVVCIAHQIYNKPAGKAAAEYAPVLIKALGARRVRFRLWRQRDMEGVYHQVGLALKEVLENHPNTPKIASDLIPVVIRLLLDAELRGSRFADAVDPLIDAFYCAVCVKGITVERKTLRAAGALVEKLATAKPSFKAVVESPYDALRLLQSQHGKAQRDVLGTTSVELRRRGTGGNVRAGQRGTALSG